MPTSLEEQLQKLAAPQSSIYTQDKTRVSLLFSPHEAAEKDRNTFYEIGLSGLEELITIYNGFTAFHDSLFNTSSKEFERAVQTKEVNEVLDDNIEKFLTQLSPYFLLQSSHKALEWLINRFHIHEYNQDAIMRLILPYNDTMIFVRFIQIMNLENSERWSWLQVLQKPGITLSRQVLYNECAKNSSFMNFVAKSIIKLMNSFGNRAHLLQTSYAFFCSTIIGAMESSKRVTEGQITTLLSVLLKAFSSSVPDFRACGYIIVGHLCTKVQLKKDLLSEFVIKIFTSGFEFNQNVALVLHLLYNTQESLNEFPDDLICDITVEGFQTACKELNQLVLQGIDITPFMLAFLRTSLPLIQTNAEEIKRFAPLSEVLISEIDLETESQEALIRCIIHCFDPIKYCQPEEYESDIEIILDESVIEGNQMTEWYSQFLRSLEQKYPNAFDKVIKTEMHNNKQLSESKRRQLTAVLGFVPAIVHKMGETFLFENLNHANPVRRIEGVKYLAKEYSNLVRANSEFVKEAIMNRLYDEYPDVVLTVLKFPHNQLTDLLTPEELTSVFSRIFQNGFECEKKWYKVVVETIELLRFVETCNLNQDLILSLLPLLFPTDKRSAKLAKDVIESPLGKSFTLTQKIGSILGKLNSYEFSIISETAFTVLQDHEWSNKEIKIIESFSNIEELSTKNTFFYILLRSNTIREKEETESSFRFLNALLDIITKSKIVIFTNGNNLSTEIMEDCLKQCKEGQLPFQVIYHAIEKIIKRTELASIPKPWYNVCESNPMAKFVRTAYEILVVGCSLKNYENSYSELLNLLLNRICSNLHEKMEFISNFVCGHIISEENRNEISSEVQLRSVLILKQLLILSENIEYIFSSTIAISLLLSLHSPLAIIRSSILDCISIIITKSRDSKNCVYFLFLKLWERKEEILMHQDEITLILYSLLSQEKNVRSTHKKEVQVNMKKALEMILSMMTDVESPLHVTSALSTLLLHINSSNFVTNLAVVVNRIHEKYRIKKTIQLDMYSSKFITQFYNRIDKSTVCTLENDIVWNAIQKGLKEYNSIILNKDLTRIAPCILLMKQIREDDFAEIPKSRRKELVTLVCEAATYGNNPAIVSSASKLMKRVNMMSEDFIHILLNMLQVKDPQLLENKRKSSSNVLLSQKILETSQWKCGVTLLENIQYKKKLSVEDSFLPLLFKIFKKCLEFEEQSYAEYTIQLLLSSILSYCQNFIATDKEHENRMKSSFDVELVVKCIRSTQNPQTHHHALVLLTHAARILPDQVLNHIMAIFAFIGTSIVRNDDAYSFQIVIKIIETIIPILVQIDGDISCYSDKEMIALQNRVVPVLRIFSDVVLDVPEHRRLPLYTKLIETLGSRHFLWVFLALLLEGHVRHWSRQKNSTEAPTAVDKSAPVLLSRLDFGQSLLDEFDPEIIFVNHIKLVDYLKSLPLIKDKESMDTDVDPSEIFSVNGHTPLQLRHYKYAIITFLNTCLSSGHFIQQVRNVAESDVLEQHYKTLIVGVLTLIQSVSKVAEQTSESPKYWSVMLHHSYDLLNNINNLLSITVFITVVRGLMTHTLTTVQRKAMELLNNKFQYDPEIFAECDRSILYSLLPPLTNIVQTIKSNKSSNEMTELELNQQTALLSIKLLTRLLAGENPKPFEPVLKLITKYVCAANISGNVMASIVLCLAELCSNIKANAIPSLPKFMPAITNILKHQRQAQTPELILLSTITAVCKIVESLPLFLSPYLKQILYEYSLLTAKWKKFDKDDSKYSALVNKLDTIKQKISSTIAPRVLIPVINQCYENHVSESSYEAIGPVMSVLAESFNNITGADLLALQNDLTSFFLMALQLRSDVSDGKNVDMTQIDTVEDEIVKALVSLVLKLSETSFRPFYFRIYDWAIRSNLENEKDRVITFYRLSSAIAQQLKGLFVLFAGHFIKNAAELLDSCNKTKSEKLYFDSEEKCILLVEHILKTLEIVFLYNSQNFVNKDRFETLMQPLVDQLENFPGSSSLQTRVLSCLTQFAVAVADDSLWKPLNYQILLKTRHNDAQIRMSSVECLVSMAGALGSSWLALLAESVPFLAELLEDGDARVESRAKEAVRQLESILGEPLQGYF